jgi:hypothetical protein
MEGLAHRRVSNCQAYLLHLGPGWELANCIVHYRQADGNMVFHLNFNFL